MRHFHWNEKLYIFTKQITGKHLDQQAMVFGYVLATTLSLFE
jgi:hypothetical protein